VRCRFCYDDEECEENPLILPCKCKGSVGLVHFNCLKQWIQMQKTSKESADKNIKSFYWKKFGCEICLQMYPYNFKMNENIYKIMDLKAEITQLATNNFILLESMPLDKEKNTSRNIHLL